MEATDVPNEEHVHIRWQSFGVVPGLSEADFMARQRYLQLTRRSGAQYSMLSLGSFQNASKKRPSTSIDVSHFIKEQRKILKTVRSQPWPMHIKINAVRHYKAAISRYTALLDKFDTVKDTTMQVKSRVNRFYIQLLKTLTIWNSIIKRIEGKFGSSVASYFTFLRWLCALNLFLSLLLIFFVILPQAFSGHGLKVSQEIKQNSSEVSFLFDGQGYILQYSVLFYGYYDSGQNEPYMPPPVNPDPYIGWRYKLPLAYLLMIPFTFGICIVAILMSIAEKYKLIQQADATDPYPFSRRVFTGWDYAVTYANTAGRKATHIATELKEIVADVVSEEQKVLSMKIFTIRILSNGTIIFLLCLSSVAIYVAVENVEKGGNYSFRTALQQGISGLWAFLLSFQVQLAIIGRNVIMRGVFLLVAVIERHHPRTALKLMLVRMFCLYVSSLYVLIIALLTISDDCTDDVSGEVCCWETIVGQEMYKLSWTQIGAEILSIFFIDGTVWIVALCGPQKVKKYVERLEFDIAHHVLQSIYSQALVWLGMLFCPFLPTINFFKCVVLFYIKLFGIMLFNRPPKAMFKISSTNNFYMGMLLLMLFLSLFPVGYAVLEIIPSTECGPFRGQTKMMDVIINEIHTWPDIVQDAIQYLQTAAVIVPLIILLCIIIYYYGALSHVLKELNKDLQVQLILERREVRARIAERLPHNDLLPVSSEKFLDTQTRDFSLEHMDDSLSITSFDTYTKDEPKILAQNIFDDAKHDPGNNNLSMYPVTSNTDDDDDDDDNENVSYIECDQDHASTFPLSNYQQQHTCGKINCCHPTKYSRKH